MTNDEKAQFLYELAEELDSNTCPIKRVPVSPDKKHTLVSDWLRARALALPED